MTVIQRVSEDWCAALANMVHIIPSIPEYAISSTLRIYISATKDLAAEVDLLVKVGVGRVLQLTSHQNVAASETDSVYQFYLMNLWNC